MQMTAEKKAAKNEGLRLSEEQQAEIFKRLRLKKIKVHTFADMCERSFNVISGALNARETCSEHIQGKILEILDYDVSGGTK